MSVDKPTRPSSFNIYTVETSGDLTRPTESLRTRIVAFNTLCLNCLPSCMGVGIYESSEMPEGHPRVRYSRLGKSLPPWADDEMDPRLQFDTGNVDFQTQLVHRGIPWKSISLAVRAQIVLLPWVDGFAIGVVRMLIEFARNRSVCETVRIANPSRRRGSQ